MLCMVLVLMIYYGNTFFLIQIVDSTSNSHQNISFFSLLHWIDLSKDHLKNKKNRRTELMAHKIILVKKKLDLGFKLVIMLKLDSNSFNNQSDFLKFLWSHDFVWSKLEHKLLQRIHQTDVLTKKNNWSI